MDSFTKGVSKYLPVNTNGAIVDLAENCDKEIGEIKTVLTDAAVRMKKVSSLPASGDPLTIYLVPSSDPETGYVCDEYIWQDNDWEKVGSTAGEGEPKVYSLATGVNFSGLSGGSAFVIAGFKKARTFYVHNITHSESIFFEQKDPEVPSNGWFGKVGFTGNGYAISNISGDNFVCNAKV